MQPRSEGYVERGVSARALLSDLGYRPRERDNAPLDIMRALLV